MPTRLKEKMQKAQKDLMGRYTQGDEYEREEQWNNRKNHKLQGKLTKIR